MSKRQNAFTIKTNKISDEVYQVLEKHAKARKLGEYISSLIVKDIHGVPFNKEDAISGRTIEMLEHISGELDEIKKLAQTNGITANKEEKQEEKPEESHHLSEGKIADINEISGSLDDDDLEEFSDF